MKYCHLLLPVLLLCHWQVSAQGDLFDFPAQPTSEGLIEYGKVPVNLYQGAADINIPIFELRGRKLSVPISLAYNSGGVKVEQIASFCGMNWNLKAGGLITRTVRGLPDESKLYDGYIKGGGDEVLRVPTKNAEQLLFYRQRVNNGGSDSEPDLFSFNFMGLSGQFFFDHTGKVHTLPHDKLKITWTENDSENAITSFTIIDDMGTTYLFSAIESMRNGLSNCERNWRTRPVDHPSYRYNSAWYLTEIRSAEGEDNIRFTYTDETLEYDRRISQTYRECAEENDQISTCSSEVKAFAKRLSTIESALGKVVFASETPRTDLKGGHRLDKILIYNHEERRPIREFKLSYEYAVAQPVSPDRTARFRRLFLKRIKEGTMGGCHDRTHLFSYHDIHRLPPRDSYAQDFWGFYNGADDNTTLLPKLTVLEEINGNPNIINISSKLLTADREPNIDYSRLGTLRKIVYPTGGHTLLEYEHHHSKGLLLPNPISLTTSAGDTRKIDFFHTLRTIARFSSVEIGGLRLLRTVTRDGSSHDNDIISNYRYTIIEGDKLKSSGIFGPRPTFASLDFYAGCDAPSISVSSSGTTLSGHHGGYKRVSISTKDNGREIHEFYTLEDFPEIIRAIRKNNRPPYAYVPNIDWATGLTKRISYFKIGYNAPVRRIDREYSFESGPEVPGLKINGPYSVDNGEYLQRTAWVKTVKVTESEVGTRGVDKSVTDTYGAYNGHLQIKQREESTGDGGLLRTYYSYPLDLSDKGNVAEAMVERHMHAKVLETKTHRILPDGQEVSAEGNRTDYKRWSNGYLLPFRFSQLVSNDAISNRFYPTATITSYDKHGNVTSYRKRDGIAVAMEWGHDDALLTKKTENTDAPPDRQQSTIYDYRPLVGPISVTDMNGISQYLSYTANGELFEIRDNDRKLLEAHEYCYTKAPLPLSISTSGPTSGITGTVVNLSANARGGYPPYTFEWYYRKGPSGTFQGPGLSPTVRTGGTEVFCRVSDSQGFTTTAYHKITAMPSPDFLRVFAPSSGTKVEQGKAVDIAWDAHGTGKVKIELFQNGALQTVIANNIALNIGLYRWSTVGYTGTGYSIKVTGIQIGLSDFSGGFSIETCAPEHHRGCHNGDVYWFDSCGNPSNRYQDCQGWGCNGSTCNPFECQRDGTLTVRRSDCCSDTMIGVRGDCGTNVLSSGTQLCPPGVNCFCGSSRPCTD